MFQQNHVPPKSCSTKVRFFQSHVLPKSCWQVHSTKVRICRNEFYQSPVGMKRVILPNSVLPKSDPLLKQTLKNYFSLLALVCVLWAVDGLFKRVKYTNRSSANPGINDLGLSIRLQYTSVKHFCWTDFYSCCSLLWQMWANRKD
jgi:hypothetical protein